MRFVLFQAALLLIIIGAFLIGALFLPLRAIIYGWPSIEETRAIVSKSCNFYISLLEKLGLTNLKIIGKEKLPKSNSYIIVANHPSLLDIVYLISLFPTCSCMAKKNLLYFSPYSLIIRWAGYVAASAGSEIVEQANIELQNNRPFVIFPEGTRKSQQEQKSGADKIKFRRGAAALALRSASPIIPVKFKYDPPVLGRSRKWYDAPDRICNVTIEFFDPIYFKKSDKPEWEQRREITLKLENFFY